MEDSPIQASVPVLKHFAPYVVAVVVGGAGLGYAVREHHAAQDLAVQNQQVTAALQTTHSQLDDLTTKVNALTAQQTKPEPAAPAVSAQSEAKHTAARTRTRAVDHRYSKLQAQLDAQGKEIDDTRNDLTNTRTELTGSIARTHDELVLLEKKGERSYYEFDIQKSKQFQREGPLGVRLKKANTKHDYADLELMVDDRNVSQKHVNIYQPVMYYQPGSQQPLEVVINDITKNHIHGYISAPKYSQSELAAAAAPQTGADTASASVPSQAASPAAQPPARRKLPLPEQ